MSAVGALVALGIASVAVVMAIQTEEWFILGFGLVALLVGSAHAYNAFSAKGLPHAVVDVELPGADTPVHPDPAERLRELDRLRRDGLVTEAEYMEQRRRILGSL